MMTKVSEKHYSRIHDLVIRRVLTQEVEDLPLAGRAVAPTALTHQHFRTLHYKMLGRHFTILVEAGLLQIWECMSYEVRENDSEPAGLKRAP